LGFFAAGVVGSGGADSAKAFFNSWSSANAVSLSLVL
jgi:hypothetical protein